MQKDILEIICNGQKNNFELKISFCPKMMIIHKTYDTGDLFEVYEMLNDDNCVLYTEGMEQICNSLSDYFDADVVDLITEIYSSYYNDYYDEYLNDFSKWIKNSGLEVKKNTN